MVNQPPPVPPVELDDHARDLLAAARMQKTAVVDAVDRYQQTVWNAAYDRGHQQGWREGYNYALWQIEQARAQVPVASTPPRAEPEPAPIITEEDDTPSAQETVLKAVAAKPGMRGVEVVAAVAPIKERTVRTALHRLKKDGQIVNINERWFLPDAAPVDEVDMD